MEFSQEEYDKLKAKNDKLMDELKTTKAKFEPLKGVSPDEIENLRKAADRLSKLEEQNATTVEEKDKIIEQMKKSHASEIEKLTTSLDSEKGLNRKLLVDNALTDELTKAGVKPEFLKYVAAGMRDQISLDGEGEERRAVVGDKSVKDHITGWAQEEGKAFISAGGDSGGGASGSGVKGFDGPNPFAKDSANVTEQHRLMSENPDLAKQLQEAAA